MPDTATKTTTTPRRATARKPAAAKATAAKPAASKAAPKEEPVSDVQRVTVEMEYVTDTKSFAKFKFPEELKDVIVGNVYAPLGTDKVKVAIFGVDADDFEVE